MLHLAKGIERLCTDALRGGIRGDQFRMFSFQRLQLAQHTIILGVRYLRIVEHVVAIVVVVDGPSE